MFCQKNLDMTFLVNFVKEEDMFCKITEVLLLTKKILKVLNYSKIYFLLF